MTMKAFFQQSIDYFAGFKTYSFRDCFQDWSIYETLWLVLCVATILVVSLASHSGLLEIMIAVTGIINMVLIAKGKIINYLFGLVSNVLYAYICWYNGIYGQFLLFLLYFVPMQFYGWYLWTNPNNQSANAQIVTKRLNTSNRFYLLCVAVFGVVFYALFLKLIGQKFAWVDDGLAGVLSVIAMFLMARFYIEQWYLWIIINIATVSIWTQDVIIHHHYHNSPLLMMWAIYLLNALYGYYNWNKIQEQERAVHG